MFGRILNMSLVRAYRLLHLHYWYLSLIFLLAYTFLSLEINLTLKKFNADCNGLLYVLLLLGSLFYRNTNSILQCFMLLFGFTRNGIGCWFEVEAIFAKKTIVNDRLDSKYFSAIPQEILWRALRGLHYIFWK